MSFNIELSDESLLDLREARLYYFEVSIELQKKFDNEIVETIERIEFSPQHFQKRYRNIKIIFTKSFPFGIHYLVDGDTIKVQRILHQKRHY
ncbi:type II toxin-antitoxin system RelE/ParE family toxin [Lacinutrix sp. Hel_I_90]|uniref:type II toxin-antitoxin system RelE/ParE family toxin n=1 Tax=Lacinutrix sp. Hel_I_90 TaxID=1249999 RepID=UPI0005CA5B10|nr:type II toxin-antitoxin system RelE/ParE family toxin [Lacinutrix sp. Hel_I_90]